MRVHERRNAAPGGFVKNGAADASHMLNLRLALKQNNITGLQQQLLAVSTPGNAQYRQFLSKAEVRRSPLSLLNPGSYCMVLSLWRRLTFAGGSDGCSFE